MDAEEAELHLAAFVDAFVTRVHRERWHFLLARPGRRTFASSSRLMSVLDPKRCVRVDGVWSIDPNREAVFFDFVEKPSVVSFSEAARLGNGRDAIVSLEPGKLAIHFSHEDWSWLCRS